MVFLCVPAMSTPPDHHPREVQRGPDLLSEKPTSERAAQSADENELILVQQQLVWAFLR